MDEHFAMKNSPMQNHESNLIQSLLQKNLTLSEAIFYIKNRAQKGQGIPDRYQCSPFRIPKDESEYAEEINLILNESIKIQSGVVPNTGLFDECILTSSGLEIAGLLRGYLDAVFKEKVTSDLVVGVMEWNENAKSESDSYDGSFHLWLDIEGVAIDNSFVKMPENQDISSYYKAMTKSTLVKEDPWTTSRRLYLGQSQGDSQMPMNLDHNMKLHKAFGRNEAVEKFIAFVQNNPERNPGVLLYDVLMRDYLKNNFNVVPANLKRKWSKKCWNCGLVELNSSQCEDCHSAVYCSQECAENDQTIHELLHKEKSVVSKEPPTEIGNEPGQSFNMF